MPSSNLTCIANPSSSLIPNLPCSASSRAFLVFHLSDVAGSSPLSINSLMASIFFEEIYRCLCLTRSFIILFLISSLAYFFSPLLFIFSTLLVRKGNIMSSNSRFIPNALPYRHSSLFILIPAWSILSKSRGGLPCCPRPMRMLIMSITG